MFLKSFAPHNPHNKAFPPISISDSIDWEDPDAYTIYNRILSKTESGSILLFHNDLENTTEALPQILTELLQKGYEFVVVEDMIYTQDYYIDNAGKQIYEPKTSAVNPVVLYADDPYANTAFEKMRQNLTLDEIYNLSVYGQVKVDVIEKNQTYLSRAEIAALYEMSYEELYAAYIALVYAAETYGAADYNPNAETTAAETTPTEAATTVPPTTTAADKTDIIYDKTDVVTTVADKTDIVTTFADKTDIIISYDKTEPIVTVTYPETTTASVTTTLPPETTTRISVGYEGDVQGEQITAATSAVK